MQNSVFWFRRDLRTTDNHGLFRALSESQEVLPVFIFDKDILDQLEKPNDKRVPFLWDTVLALKTQLQSLGSDLKIFYGSSHDVWKELAQQKKFNFAKVYCNEDYEPKAIARDQKIADTLKQAGIQFLAFKDQVHFAKTEILNLSGKPYTVFTPYKNKWKELYQPKMAAKFKSLEEIRPLKVLKNLDKLLESFQVSSLEQMGFVRSAQLIYPKIALNREALSSYDKTRDFPALDTTSRMGLHLRFGTVSVRELVAKAFQVNDVWLSELIWREFFMQIMYNFPHVDKTSFKPIYDQIAWRDSAEDFTKWCEGKTGYPLVDAGMRELNSTGHMHNRVRMVTASFLTKHLLIHWRKGERYFASQLLDFDLSANNGNWQWAAGSGCDAAPYFRVFNPQTQFEKFDPKGEYVKKYVPEYLTSAYPQPMIEHKAARDRALLEYGKILKNKETTE